MAPMRVQGWRSKLPITSPPAAILQTGISGTFFRHCFFKTPPFILEKRQILMQGSLSVWVAEVMQKFR
jgi:hypothetical protein